MNTILKNAKNHIGLNHLFDPEATYDLLIVDGKIHEIAENIPEKMAQRIIRCDNCLLLPGFIDVHVHFREPGFEYKETIKTGSESAAAGGFTTVCTMPNLDPAPWDMTGLKVQMQAIKTDACMRVIPYGRITRPSGSGSVVADLEEMAPYVFAFSDDGAGVQQDELMEEAMKRAKDLGKIIVAHSEDTNYAPHDPRSEWKQVKRDLDLVAKTGCSYHVCHVSTRESLELIAEGKKSGLDVTCETAPHYLVFSKADIEKRISDLGSASGGRFKMNPPIRTEQDKEALLQAVADGTVDMIATDHAPHSSEEKSGGFEKSMNGILGLETAFPVMYTSLVEGGVIDMSRLIELMSTNPAKRFSIEGGVIEAGKAADIAVVDLNEEFHIDPAAFKSKGRSTPFEGMKVRGKVKCTISEGNIVYNSLTKDF